MRRLIPGLLGAALALGAAHGRALTQAHGHAVAPGAVSARVPELRAASERIPKAPLERAARTRRPSAAGSTGILPAPVATGAVGAPVILVVRGRAALVSRPSECGHCTRAPRPPPIS
ncbi:MAG: hypothetical protein H6Q77_1647 [Gemmatimonadetes bacterium]|nr:hypothetical protein [Gemmatimonadota bacterium]